MPVFTVADLPDVPGETGRVQQARADAERFLRDWSERAATLGWTKADLFGLHPEAPWARYDQMGLIWFLQGRTVVALDRVGATLAPTRTGNALVWRRPVTSGPAVVREPRPAPAVMREPRPEPMQASPVPVPRPVPPVARPVPPVAPSPAPVPSFEAVQTPAERRQVALRLYRDERWSQTKIAEALHVDQKTISRDLAELGAMPNSRRGRPRKAMGN